MPDSKHTFSNRHHVVLTIAAQPLGKGYEDALVAISYRKHSSMQYNVLAWKMAVGFNDGHLWTQTGGADYAAPPNDASRVFQIYEQHL